jgi:hypothetical protein
MMGGVLGIDPRALLRPEAPQGQGCQQGQLEEQGKRDDHALVSLSHGFFAASYALPDRAC